jgi:NitT/TauT family transport system permease protein
MAQTGHLTQAPRTAAPWLSPVTRLRILILLTVLVIWEGVAASGILLRDVVPSTVTIARSLADILFHPDLKVSWAGAQFSIPAFYWHLYVTIMEVATALVIGGLSGLAVGLALGANPFLAKAFERYLYYLGPTPKIIFFPVMIMWFGVGSGSKIALGTLSCFFPVALSVAAGMRQIDRVLIRVGRSFRANTLQMVWKIYLPAMRHPMVNGVRLGLGVALIGTLLAETKLSNKGIGFLIINAYSTFDMPRMYANLIVLFVVAIGANALVGRLGGLHTIRR